MPEEEIGVIMEFFARPVVAGIRLTAPLRAGDTIRIHGHTTDVTLPITSMQLNNQPVAEAQAGQVIGVKVPDRVRRGDKVYKVTP